MKRILAVLIACCITFTLAAMPVHAGEMPDECMHMNQSTFNCSEPTMCMDCGMEIAPPLGHCPAGGGSCLDATFCMTCGEELIPAPGHYPAGDATCSAASVCIACGIELAPKLAHTPSGDATCSAASVCTECGAEIAPKLAHTPSGDATCTAASVCTVCSAEIAPKLAHTPSGAATCLAASVCTVCSAELAPKLTHISSGAATCSAASVCTLCGAELTPKLAHTPSGDATCSVASVCTVCSAELAAKLPHTPSGSATCAAASVCTVCSAELAPKLAHTPSGEATCQLASTCTVCSAELAPKLAHTWQFDEHYDGSCSPHNASDGGDIYVCVACGDSENRPVPVGHTAPDPIPFTNCLGVGNTYHCDICGYHYAIYTTENPGAAHQYASYEPKRLTENCFRAIETLYCTVCSEEYKQHVEEFSAPRHQTPVFDHTETAATCVCEGVDVYCCPACGDELEYRTAAPLGHTPVYASCDAPLLCGVCGEVLANAGHHPAQAVDCTHATVCTVCGKTIPATAHVPVGTLDCTHGVYCGVCGVQITPALGHDWQFAYDNDHEATCLHENVMTYECGRSGCEAYEERVIPKRTDHAAPEWERTQDCYSVHIAKVCSICNDEQIYGGSEELFSEPRHQFPDTPGDHRDATCTKEGYDAFVCEKCGVEQRTVILIRTDHQPPQGQRVAITCRNVVMRYNCTTCGTASDVPVYGEYLDHTWDEGREVDGCNCVYLVRTCTACGEMEPVENVRVVRNKETLAHVALEFRRVVLQPTCDKEGLASYYCNGDHYGCYETVTLAIPATGVHTPVGTADCTHASYCRECAQVVTPALGHNAPEATCTQASVCSVCSATIAPALGHNAPEATCTQASVCSVCGATIAPALGHTPAETADCTHASVCARCDATLEKALGHAYVFVQTVAPTQTERGYDLQRCKRCGATRSVNYTDVLPPDPPPAEDTLIENTARQQENEGTKITLEKEENSETVTLKITAAQPPAAEQGDQSGQGDQGNPDDSGNPGNPEEQGDQSNPDVPGDQSEQKITAQLPAQLLSECLEAKVERVTVEDEQTGAGVVMPLSGLNAAAQGKQNAVCTVAIQPVKEAWTAEGYTPVSEPCDVIIMVRSDQGEEALAADESMLVRVRWIAGGAEGAVGLYIANGAATQISASLITDDAGAPLYWELPYQGNGRYAVAVKAQ